MSPAGKRPACPGAASSVQAVDTKATRYDTATVALHWLTALLVVAQWCVAQMIDWAPRGAPRVPMRSLHLSIGVILVVLVVGRLAWRATRGRRLPAADPGPLHAVAKATHWGLYALLVTILGLGLVLWWVRADTWFFLWSPPPADPANAGGATLRRTMACHPGERGDDPGGRARAGGAGPPRRVARRRPGTDGHPAGVVSPRQPWGGVTRRRRTPMNESAVD